MNDNYRYTFLSDKVFFFKAILTSFFAFPLPQTPSENKRRETLCQVCIQSIFHFY